MVDKHSAPAFSIGTSSLSQRANNEFVPGPGAYQTPSLLAANKNGSNMYAYRDLAKAIKLDSKTMQHLYQALELTIKLTM